VTYRDSERCVFNYTAIHGQGQWEVTSFAFSAYYKLLCLFLTRFVLKDHFLILKKFPLAAFWIGIGCLPWQSYTRADRASIFAVL